MTPQTREAVKRWWKKLLPFLADFLFSFLVLQLYGFLIGGLYSGYVFSQGDPALIGAMIKEHGKHWLSLDLHFSEQPFFYPYRGVTYFTENFIGQGLLLAPFSNKSVVYLSHLTYWLGLLLSLFAIIQVLRLWIRNTWVVYFVSTLWALNPQRALTYGYTQGNFQNIWDFSILLCGWSLMKWHRSRQLGWVVLALLFFWSQFFFSCVYPILCFLVILIPLVLGLPDLRRQIWKPALWIAVAFGGYWMLSNPYREVGKLFEQRYTVEQVALLSSTILGSIKWFAYSSSARILDHSQAFVSGESILPGVFLTILVLGSLRHLKLSSKIRWGWALSLILFLCTLGPVIQWHKGEELFGNPLWIWTIDHSPTISAIRVPNRFLIGLHWLFAWQGALFLDRFKAAERIENTRWKWAAVPIVLSLLFLTDLRVRVNKVISQNLSEPVHHRLTEGAVVAELPTAFSSKVRFRTLALASELSFHTIDGQAAFITPLAGWLQFLTQMGLTQENIQCLRPAGVTSILLHCHVFAQTGHADYCETNTPVLLNSGYRIKYKDENDILFEARRPSRLRMLYDSVDPRLFKYEARARGGTPYLAVEPKKSLLVAFPSHCYPLEIKVFPAEQVVSRCYSSVSFLAAPMWIKLPDRAEALVVSPPASRPLRIPLRW